MMIICSDKVQEYDTAIKMFKIIFQMKPHIFSDFHLANLMFNTALYIDRVNNTNDIEFKQLFKEYYFFLKKNNVNNSVFDNIYKFYEWIL
jgi:hypothetical protein